MRSFLTTAMVVTGLAALALATQSAQADTFDFIYVDTATNGMQIEASGVLTTDALAGGHYQVIGITGQRNGSMITSLSGFASADNLLFTAPSQYVDYGGLSYDTASGLIANLYGYGSGYGDLNSVDSPLGDSGGVPVTLTITSAVPEPGLYQMSAVLVLSGIGVLRLRRKEALKSAA